MENVIGVTTPSDNGTNVESGEGKWDAEQTEKVFKAPEAPSQDIPREQSVDSSKYYNPPSWKQTCPSNSSYYLEVIKNGIPLPEATIDLSDIDHCILGRQPGSLLNPQNPVGRTSTLLHPSISRVHAVLQFGNNSDVSPGWYIYDLDSTHGTFVNKHRLPSGRYIRLRVGYVLRFGNSTRLLILNGPESDVEAETKETWSEMVARKKSKLAKISKEEKESRNESNEGICNWGIIDDYAEDENLLQQRLAESGNCLSHEKSYIEDPKRALRAFFDRKGIDPLPEYEFVEGRFGQNCRIELPLELGTVFAEVPMTGRNRKAAVVACALEACRMLDRLGEFDNNEGGAEALRRAREKAYWQSNDYYSSDEDTFLDRTGQIEVRRRRRMRRMGAEVAEDTEVADFSLKEAPREAVDSLSVLTTLEKVGQEIVEVEEQLNAAERAMEAVGENASEMDELEAYMDAIKRGAPKRAEREALKRRLMLLRQEETRLFRSLGIQGRGSGGARFSAAAAAIRAAANTLKQESDVDSRRASLVEPAHPESKLNSLKRTLNSSALGRSQAAERPLKSKVVSEGEEEEAFVPEEDDDVHNDVESIQESLRFDADPLEKATKKDDLRLSPPLNSPLPPKSLSGKNGDSSTLSAEVVHSMATPSSSSPSPKRLHEKVEVNKVRRPLIGPLPPPSGHINQAVRSDSSPLYPTDSSSSMSLPPKNEAEEDTYDFDVNDPNFSLWMPPPDQTGDGMIELNKKYGY